MRDCLLISLEMRDVILCCIVSRMLLYLILYLVQVKISIKYKTSENPSSRRNYLENTKEIEF